MSLPRRSFVLAGLTLAGSMATSPFVSGQHRAQNSVHPPEPSGHEFDMLLRLEGHASSSGRTMNARRRDLQFRSCLDELLSSATELRDQISRASLSEILSVEVYRETQAMERLVKQLKSLAKS